MSRDRKKVRAKKGKKFRLLLDAAFAHPSVFSYLNKKANLAHVVHDFELSRQVSDEEIYQLAIKENRFVVTINYKDFRKLIKSGKPAIIAIPPYLTNEEIDKILTKFIAGKSPDDYMGKAIKVSR